MANNSNDPKGEGNRQAGRNYREDVRDTVNNTTAQERANKARDVDPEEFEELKKAEEKGRSQARS